MELVILPYAIIGEVSFVLDGVQFDVFPLHSVYVQIGIPWHHVAVTPCSQQTAVRQHVGDVVFCRRLDPTSENFFESRRVVFFPTCSVAISVVGVR